MQMGRVGNVWNVVGSGFKSFGNGMQPFEIVEHTADWALKVSGADLRALLVNAALGMGTLLVGDLDALARRGATAVRSVTLDAFDAESLLVGWLEELAFWAEMEQLVFFDFELVDVSDTHLRATLHGATAVALEKHIKAVTYHDLAIRQTEQGLEVTIVFDV